MKIALLGVSGRMGQTLLGLVAADSDLQLAGGTASPKSESLAREIAPGVRISSDVRAVAKAADVVIDFTLPAATAANLAACVAEKRPIVIGATGHDKAALDAIEAAAKSIPVVFAPNMSIGVNVLLTLVKSVAATLGDDYDIEIFEAHHRNKKDAPSGTALALGRAAAAGRKVDLESVADYARHGETGVRRRGAIGFSVVRGGDIVGEHVVTFAGPGERIEIAHRAQDRRGFARGALAAAKWLHGRNPGLYSMMDVLNLAPLGG